MKKRERERERERENNLFCVKKLCIEWKRKYQIYGNVLRIRRVKINEDKRVENDLFLCEKTMHRMKKKMSNLW